MHNSMKSNLKYIASLFAGGLIGLTACTDSFEEYNTNQAGFPDQSKEQEFNKYGISLGVVQQGIYFNYDWGGGKNWPFQVMQNLSSDMFSGYVHDFNPFAAGHGNTTYGMQDAWNGSSWDNTYGYIMTEVKKSEDLTEKDYPSFYGITKILKVELMHRISDLYGPIIYTQFGSKTGSMPDKQSDAYKAFFKDLDTGISMIQAYMDENPGVENFAKFDILTPKSNRTYAEWVKFGNSLRLRLAVRIAMADPALAASEVKKALTDKGGLLQDDEDIIAVSAEGTGYNNPFGEINKGWGEVFLNANMESYLGGYEDPRLEKFFNKAAGGVGEEVVPVKGTYKGIRQGTGFNHTNYTGHSRSTVGQTTGAVLMTAAEVWFLRAEAALRGWSAENVQTCYENGVKASFAQWKAKEVAAYLESEKAPKDYEDAFDAAYNIKAVGAVTPKWNTAATNEEKLEKIITQKWIACYPEGVEGWTEQRRTGYPRLFPVKVNDSQGTIDSKVGPRRLNFSVTIITANPEQYSALTSALGGADNCGTRLWWDTGRNF